MTRLVSNNTIAITFCLLLIITAVITNNNTSIIIPSFATDSRTIRNQNIDANIILAWNNLTTQLGIKEKLSPPEFSRAYALVHISIYDSLLAVAGNKTKVNDFLIYNNNNNNNNNTSLYVSFIVEAASTVLLYLFPNHVNEIIKLKSNQINRFQDDNDLLLKRGRMIGYQVSQAVIDYAKTDNSNLIWKSDTIHARKNDNCTWSGTNPVNPMVGFWKTHILKSGAEVQPEKPAQCGSVADLLNVRRIYEASKHRTPEQIAAVHYWGDKPPPVIWNNILNQQIQKYKNNMSIFDIAYSGVYLNVAIYDAFISCWYTKYDYWTARPFQRISNFTTEIPTPNFPGYTSGHSVISMVASKVLGKIFPQEKSYFHNQAVEAALSRLWAGIHFKQDVINGMDQGDKIANKIVEDMHKAIHPFIYN